MKARGYLPPLFCLCRSLASTRPGFIGVWLCAGLLLCVGATEGHAGKGKPQTQASTDFVSIELATTALICTDKPATVSIEVATGRTLYAGDEAGSAARSFLEYPDFGDAGLDMAAGPVCFVLAPFAAAYKAVAAHDTRIPAQTLTQAEASLASAMDKMAEQRHLRDCVRSEVEQTTGGKLLNDRAVATPAASAVLETTIEELRLKPKGSSETSFALNIRARARLLRAADGAVLWSQPLQYQSGTALFLDWADAGSLENVARTGYQELARQVAAKIKLVTAQGPVLVGAGWKTPTPRPAVVPVLFASTRPARSAGALVQVVDYPVGDPERFGIYSPEVASRVALQQPLTRQEAVDQAVKDVSWALDDLHQSRNSVVQLSAIAVAVPYSLTKQVVAGLRGVSAGKLRAAQDQLMVAARNTGLQKKLAGELAQRLAPRLGPPAVLVSQPGKAAAAAEQTALGVDIVSAALKGEGETNPSLTLCVESRATVFRLRDRAVLYSWPIHYRSTARKFTKWAEKDARLFREELKRCHQLVAGAVIDQLAARQLIGPEQGQNSMLLASEP